MSIINNEDVLETAATLWDIALHVIDTPFDSFAPRGAHILKRLRHVWGTSETRRLVASMAPACWAAWVHMPEDYRADHAFDEDHASAWLVDNVEGYATAADLWR